MTKYTIVRFRTENENKMKMSKGNENAGQLSKGESVFSLITFPHSLRNGDYSIELIKTLCAAGFIVREHHCARQIPSSLICVCEGVPV